MDEHIEFDEMTDVAFMNKVDNANEALILKVQLHIINCLECRTIYDNLVSLSEVTDNLIADSILTSNRKVLALKAIHEFSKKAALSKERVNKWTGKVLSDVGSFLVTVKTNIGEITELIPHQNKHYDFGYPISVGTRGSKRSEKNKSILIDNQDSFNRIYIDDNDALVIELSADSIDVSDPTLLLVTGSGEVRMVKLLLKNRTYIAQIRGVADGEYYIFVE